MYTFRCDCVGFIIYVGNTRVKFESDFNDVPRGLFATNDEKLAEGLRKHKYFVKGTIVETTPKQAEETKQTTSEEKKEDASVASVVYDDVTRTQEAIKILKEKHGVTTSMRTRDDMLSAAAAAGVSFPKIK